MEDFGFHDVRDRSRPSLSFGKPSSDIMRRKGMIADTYVSPTAAPWDIVVASASHTVVPEFAGAADIALKRRRGGATLVEHPRFACSVGKEHCKHLPCNPKPSFGGPEEEALSGQEHVGGTPLLVQRRVRGDARHVQDGTGVVLPGKDMDIFTSRRKCRHPELAADGVL